MPQNRKKMLDLFIGNISSAISHEILMISTENKELASRYKKERDNLIVISEKYRHNINPISDILPDKDIEYIKSKVKNKIKSELSSRIKKGYRNINLNIIEELIEKYLRAVKVI